MTRQRTKSQKFDRAKIEDGLLARLVSLAKGEPDVVPSGHRTSEQWAALWGKSLAQAQALIRAGLRAKLLASVKYRIASGNRPGLYPVVHYYELKRKP